MQELTKADLNFVLSRCPRDIIKLLRANPGTLFLAGGFIRATIAGEKAADIDLFGISRVDLLRIAKDLTLERKGRFFETKNAVTVLAPPRFPVQFITRWVFTAAADLVSSFDFTICHAAIWAEKEGDSIKFRSMISDTYYADLAARRLVYTHPRRIEEAGESLMRAVKFIKRGYNIQAPSLAGIAARLALAVDKNIMGQGDEKWITKIMTGLLREVDPLTVIDGVDFVDEHEVLVEVAP